MTVFTGVMSSSLVSDTSSHTEKETVDGLLPREPTPQERMRQKIQEFAKDSIQGDLSLSCKRARR